MTASQEKYGPQEWDAFFDFLAEDAIESTPEEARANLKSHRIDVASAVSRVKRALESAQARASLSEAAARRQAITSRLIDRVRDAAMRPCVDAKIQLESILAQFQGDMVPQAYFNRLKEASTQADIQSLADDIEALDLFCDYEDVDDAS